MTVVKQEEDERCGWHMNGRWRGGSRMEVVEKELKDEQGGVCGSWHVGASVTVDHCAFSFWKF